MVTTPEPHAPTEVHVHEAPSAARCPPEHKSPTVFLTYANFAGVRSAPRGVLSAGASFANAGRDDKFCRFLESAVQNEIPIKVCAGAADH